MDRKHKLSFFLHAVQVFIIAFLLIKMFQLQGQLDTLEDNLGYYFRYLEEDISDLFKAVFG